MSTATITTKGQITIPKDVRESLSLKTGDKLEMIVTDNKEAIIRPISKSVEEVFGMLHNPEQKTITVQEMNDAIRKRMKDNQ